MLLVDVAIRASLILLAALVACFALRRATAATRHLVLTLAVACVLALPALMVSLPGWRILPGDAGRAALSRVDDATRLSTEATPVTRSASTPAPVAKSFAPRQSVIAFTVWLLIAMLLIVRIAAGIIAVQGLARRSRPADARWRTLLDEVTAGAGERRSVRLLVSTEIAMPMTWGGRRPLLLLPADARHWSDERARVVLLHELAHILRADWLTHAVGRVAVALHWFNPLAWMAVGAMTRERERACDDYVLARGARAADYARHLLDIASSDGPSPAYAIAPAMARRSELEGRLLSILTPHRVEPGRVAGRAVTLAALIATAAISAASPVEDGQAPPKEPAPAARIGQPGIHRTDEDTRAQRESVAALAGALTDESRDVRERAALGLAMTSDHGVIEPLILALQDPDAEVREKAAIGLGFRSESSVVDPLLAALGDRSSQVREKAAIGLGLRRLPRVTDALIKAAADPDPQVREKVVVALGLSGDTRATAAIVAATKDPDSQVREKAITALTLQADDSGLVQAAVRGALGAIFGSDRNR